MSIPNRQIGTASSTENALLSSILAQLGRLTEVISASGGGGGGGLSGTLTAPRIPFASGTSSLTDDASIIYGGSGSIIMSFAGASAQYGYGSIAFTNSYNISGTGALVLGGTTTITSSIKHNFTPTATLAGLNVGSRAGNPSSLSNGDLWYNSTGNVLNARINGATVSLGAGTTYTASNGITLTGNNFKLGGALDVSTAITMADSLGLDVFSSDGSGDAGWYINGNQVTLVAGNGADVTNLNFLKTGAVIGSIGGDFTIAPLAGGRTLTFAGDGFSTNNFANIFIVSDTDLQLGNSINAILDFTTTLTTFSSALNKGIDYGGDYSANYTTRTLIDKGYVLNAKTFLGKQTFIASGSAAASITLPHGTAPTSPINGDMWTTTAGLFVRINGVTVGPLS